MPLALAPSSTALHRATTGMLCALLALLAGCATAPSAPPAAPPPEASEQPSPTPRKKEGPSRLGNPDSYVVFGKRYRVWPTSQGYRERGYASWYGPKFHGRSTSSGQPFDMHQISAAHRHLPIPTYVQVTHLKTGKRLIVRVNDRGPFVDGRIIDLSYAAAQALGMVTEGTAPVLVEALEPYQYLPGRQPSALAAARPAFSQGSSASPQGAGEPAFTLRATASQ